MPPPTIDHIVSLRGLGVFRDYTATQDLPAMRRHNLIYGFNGSGKTTLARVLASLTSGVVRPELPADGTFELKLTDGIAITNGANLEVLKGRMLVFNIDFVEENLRWKEGTANPVFYLGKAQAELNKELEKKAAALVAMEPQLRTAEKENNRADKTFADHKRDTARLIAEQLGLGRRYDATNLAADYAKRSYDEELKLSDDDQKPLRIVIAQDTPLPKRNVLDAEPFDFSTMVRRVRTILSTTLGTMAVADLRDHETMLNWVKEGADYHQAHALSLCLLCGNELTTERMDALAKLFDDRFNKLTRDIAQAKRDAELFRDRVMRLNSTIPSRNDISRDLQTKFDPAADQLRSTLAAGSDFLHAIATSLEKKEATPNIGIDAAPLPSDKQAAEWDETVGKRLAALNDLLMAHNTSHDQFTQLQDQAKTKLKNHFLADGQVRYREMDSALNAAKSALDDLQAKQAELVRETERLKQEVRQHGPAADMINRMIHGYLGHKELEIATLEEGYELRRNGRPVAGSLCEGEKTAIALCYFLSTLEAEGRKLKELIVVVDDPISSLDTKALNYAFSIIKSALAQAGQLIIMTHNLHFMNETKKWLKKKTEKEAGKDKATAALFFLDAVQQEGADTRSSSIKELPKYIREYESEYHYLFHLILEFARSDDGKTGYFYIIPNALRKVLEIFLAFKLPGSEGLSSKVEQIAAGNYGIDPGRIRALDRLVQLESHADNLDDLVTFSSMMIEETKDAADALLEVMKILDKGHYDRLSGICG